MSQTMDAKSQEEYEDDFEKDLDWLIGEEGRSEDQDPECNNIEAEIDKELAEDEKPLEEIKPKEKHHRERHKKTEVLEEEEERWPPPMEPEEYDSEKDSPPPDVDEQTEEEKKYMQEKIQQANRELQDQEAPDSSRRRRLHFKETLVDLVVPPLQFEKDGISSEVEGGKGNKDRLKDMAAETLLEKLSELRLSSQVGASDGVVENSDGGQGLKDGRVLVEKDGKFDFVSLKELESQGLLPPIANNGIDHLARSSPQSSSKIHSASSSASSPRSRVGSSTTKQGIDHLRTPRPPTQPRNRPSSANHSLRGVQRRDTRRRVQSATGTFHHSTYVLSPQQKELLHRIQEKKEKIAREAEEKKCEEEEQRRQENELAFKAWLLRKRGQLQEEKRVIRAQEMERIHSLRDSLSCDSDEAYKLWLQRKQEQRQKEKQMEELKKLEEDGGYLLHSREECERAFKLWMRRKWVEKRAEKQAAREHSRRLVLEERRARRVRDLQCSVNETKPFRFSEHLTYHF